MHNIPCYLARTQANERAGYEAGNGAGLESGRDAEHRVRAVL